MKRKAGGDLTDDEELNLMLIDASGSEENVGRAEIDFVFTTLRVGRWARKSKINLTNQLVLSLSLLIIDRLARRNLLFPRSEFERCLRIKTGEPIPSFVFSR